MRHFLFLVIAICLYNCKPTNEKTRTETLEIFSTKGDGKTMEAGEMKYFESSEYDGKRKISTSYFEANGTLKGKEIFSYDGQDSVPIKADYVDNQNKLLSYYRNVKNQAGRMIASYAFDAANNDLLRVEQYYYSKGRMISKRIFDSQLNPNRRYAFTHDEFGNETGFQVYNAADSLVVNEEFKITKLDENKRWVEKWGFANGKPVTLHKRK
jgi:hypothetical protein